ncbi:secondary thiamine-phosphate synthase enzyme YjbQ [Pelagibius sp. Alg239-R121]|uniref:secondary thiamine-phosphate synthase enzyme YjbQ n=1 Tax=Pelagibius sp. Alg239-R121 TaxID=2993448 RepID=UPI0024A63C3E|nr:secondary thiamine-phosphate synthase enzyme YjbQ [Pelagibius sp. Alg239-R121]
MQQSQTTVMIPTTRQGLIDITAEVLNWLEGTGIQDGLLTLFCRHTSASLTIQENADPDVQRDLETFFSRMVAEDPALYRHTAEGPDDMPAHIRAALTQTQLCIPVQGARLLLGTWQGIYLFEHRRAPHRRQVALHLIGS